MNSNFKLDSISDAINDIKLGKIIIVVDDENRENEGDFICAAEMVTPDLVNFMISGPIIIQVLEGNEAISRNREIMGATNPEEAKEGTIRKEFALSIEANSVHGSDSEETAKEEINFFFDDSELISEN